MRALFYFNNLEEYLAIASVVEWLESDCIFYTSTKTGKSVGEANSLKYRYIKDVRVLVWEMARWKPKVFIQSAILPTVFPRNGEKTIFVPQSIEFPTDIGIKAYDYIICPGHKYLDYLVTNMKVPQSKLRVLGLPRGESGPPFIKKSKHIYKPNGNAGLRVATFIHTVASSNFCQQLSLPSEPHLKKA